MLHKTESIEPIPFWFPGRWIEGASLIIAPLLLLLAQLLLVQFEFFFPQQLKAFDKVPTQVTTAYSLFLAGNILLWPAIVTLAKLVGQREPAWALWGGTLVMLGLFARTFHYGINHLAFQLVKVQTLQLTTKAVPTRTALSTSFRACRRPSCLAGLSWRLVLIVQACSV